VASYIESATQDAKSLATILAHHWREGGDNAKAVEYLVQAAEQALDGWALEQAVALYDSAVELAADEEKRKEIRLARGLARSRLGDYPAAIEDLGALLPELTGRPRIEALLGWTWATHWTERSEETLAGAEEALRLAEKLQDRELIPVATGRIGQAHAMRGGPGDLDAAVELGDESRRNWVDGARSWERVNQDHMLGEVYYWTGHIAQAHELASEAIKSAAGPQSIEAQLRSAALRAQVLCSMGRYEECLALFDQTMRLAAELGRPLRIIRNYSTQPLRELFDLDEARRRSEECLDGPDEATGFTMPRTNALADLVQALVPAGDLAAAERTWRIAWDETQKTHAWDRWLVGCRLAATRAEMAIGMGRLDEAIEWGRKTIDMSLTARRVKYEIAGRIALGHALVASGKQVEAVPGLRMALEQADRLGEPPKRWRAEAVLGRALYATGDDNGAQEAFAAASAIIREVAAGLTPERSARFLAVEEIRDVLGSVTKVQR
jgi:tetratricopeptide (TPR) repeat protein